MLIEIRMENKKYANQRMKEASKLMSDNTGNGLLYEYHKGQFLAFREMAHLYYRKWGSKTNEDILLENREKKLIK